MEFDINLILVPVTLVLLVAYLADKFWLKQHRLVQQNSRLCNLAQTHYDDTKKELEARLHAHYGVFDAERFTPSDSTPADIAALYQNFNTARLKLAETKSHLNDSKEFFLVRWAYEFLPILTFLVVVRSFIVEPFNIPSSSMVPSLYTGDFILVNKFAYGVRLPIIHTKILNTGSPKNGDVVVFRYPNNPKRYYIKRLIGVAGDTVEFNNGVLSINGQKIDTVASSYTMDDSLVAGLYPTVINGQTITKEEQMALGKEEESYARYHTEMLGKHQYQVRYLADLNSSRAGEFLNQVSPEVATSGGTRWKVVVPEGQYFVMGDNRDRSEDSRFWGFVPEANLAGKATYIWMHKEAGLKVPSFSRVGKID